jgi:hypothetical protein
MGINRYDKAPEWNPGVLPYELILKAADMTQQRWDKAKASGDELANELFKSVEVVPRSVDEQVVLPGVMKEYQDLSTRLSNDPDMNPTKYQMEVGNFVNRNKSLLNRMTNLANLYQAGITTKLANMQDPKFREDNIYFDHEQPDLTAVDSRTQDDWENKIGYKAQSNYNPFITKSYLDQWLANTVAANTNAAGQVSSVTSKEIDDLAEKATASATNYLTTGNYDSWIKSGKLDGMRPDEVFFATDGKTYFDGKTIGEMPPLEKAKAMIMLTGMEQLHNKNMLTKANSGRGRGTAKNEKGIVEPFDTIIGTTTLLNNDIATLTNSTVTNGGILQTVKPSTISRPGTYSGDPQMDRDAALIGTIETVLNNNNVTGILNRIKTSEDAVTKNLRDLQLGGPEASIARARQKGDELLLAKNVLELGETLESIKTQPQYLEVAAMLSEQGYDVKTPREMAQAYSKLMLKDAQAKANMKPEQRRISDAIALTFGKTEMVVPVSYTGENNVYDFGTTKAVKGVAVLGTEAEVIDKLEAANSNLMDVDKGGDAWFDMGDYRGIFGEGSWEGKKSLDNAFPGMFVKVPVTKTVDGQQVTTEMVGLNVYQPINLYDPNVRDRYNSSKLTGTTSEEFRGEFNAGATVKNIKDRIDRTMKIFEKNPSHIPSWGMRLAGTIALMPEKVKKIVEPMFESYKDPNTGKIANIQGFAGLYNTITNFGNDHESLYKFLTQVDEDLKNFQQLQGQQGNPLEGLQP